MLPKVAPVLPLVLEEVGYISFLASDVHVCVRAMQLEGVLHSQVVDLGSALDTVVPEGKRTVELFHVLVYCLFNELYI